MTTADLQRIDHQWQTKFCSLYAVVDRMRNADKYNRHAKSSLGRGVALGKIVNTLVSLKFHPATKSWDLDSRTPVDLAEAIAEAETVWQRLHDVTDVKMHAFEDDVSGGYKRTMSKIRKAMELA